MPARRGASLQTVLLGIVTITFIAAALWLHFDRQNRRHDTLDLVEQRLEAQIVEVDAGRDDRISIEGTRGTDQLLELVNGLDDLKSLKIEHADLTNAGLGKLTRLPGLRTLIIAHCDIDNKGLEHLARNMPDLDTLVLIHTRVTSAGVWSLQPLRHLNSIALDGRSQFLGDEALTPMSTMATLRSVQLGPKLFTEAGVERLRKELTHCAVLVGEFGTQNWP